MNFWYSIPSFLDADGDGDMDVFLGEYGTFKLIYLENTDRTDEVQFTEQDATFNPWHGINVGSHTVVALVDLDSDGDADAVVGNNNGHILYFLNIGDSPTDSVFEQQIGGNGINPFHGIDVGMGAVPSFMDDDGDTDMDMYVGSNAGDIFYYKNVGSVTNPVFEKQEDANSPFSSIDVSGSAHTKIYGVMSYPCPVDLNNDGLMDMLVGNWIGDVLFFKNIGTKTKPIFDKQVESSNPFWGNGNTADMVTHMAKPSIVDLDQDGLIDVFVSDYQSVIKYFKNTGSLSKAVFTEQDNMVKPPFLPSTVQAKTLAFFGNGDGPPDVYMGTNVGNIIFLSGSLCLPTDVCSLRGDCVSSSTNTVCKCFAGEYGGDNCQSCVQGKIEKLYEGGKSLKITRAPVCRSCPAGYWSNLVGYGVSASCTACEVGHRFNDSVGVGTSIDDCIFCNINQYQDQSGKTLCFDCVAGMYQNEKGQSQCKECDAGRFEKEKVCTDCTLIRIL